MSHKHCVFCGEEVPVPRPTNWSLVCESPLNNTIPDTVGKRYHAVIVGTAKREPERAAAPPEPSECSPEMSADEFYRKNRIAHDYDIDTYSGLMVFAEDYAAYAYPDSEIALLRERIERLEQALREIGNGCCEQFLEGGCDSKCQTIANEALSAQSARKP